MTEFASRAELTANHGILASLPIRTYWTTNYDTLLKRTLEAAGKSPDVKSSTQNLTTTRPLRDAVICNMYGHVSQPHDTVVTRDDYEQYAQKRQLFATALQGISLRKHS